MEIIWGRPGFCWVMLGKQTWANTLQVTWQLQPVFSSLHHSMCVLKSDIIDVRDCLQLATAFAKALLWPAANRWPNRNLLVRIPDAQSLKVKKGWGPSCLSLIDPASCIGPEPQFLPPSSYDLLLWGNMVWSTTEIEKNFLIQLISRQIRFRW